MKRSRTAILLLSFVTWWCAASDRLLAEAPAQKLDFARDIKPILSNNCFQCHGPDAKHREGGGDDGLRLDTPQGATAELGGHAAVVPGHPEKSALLERINSPDADEAMPPKSTGKRLLAAEIKLLEEWIR